MECRLRWRLCLLDSSPTVPQNSFHPLREATNEQNARRRSLTARRQTVRPYLVIGGVLLSLLRQGFSSSPPFDQPPVARKSFHDRDLSLSRFARLSSVFGPVVLVFFGGGGRGEGRLSRSVGSISSLKFLNLNLSRRLSQRREFRNLKETFLEFSFSS